MGKSEGEAREKKLEWLGLAICTALLTAGILTTFWWMASDPREARFLGIGDSWKENGPKLFYLDHAIHHGELPLWNPLILCGEPFAAHPQSFLFYPPNLLRSLLTFNPTPIKTHIGIVWMVFFHIILAGVSMYALARHHQLGFGASLVSSFAFTFSAPLVSRTFGHWQFTMMIAWLPLLLLLARKGMMAQTPAHKVRYGLLGGLVLGFAFLAGSPHILVLIAFTLGCYWIMQFFVYTKLKPSQPMTDLPKLALAEAGMLAIVVIVGVLVAAAMLLPAAEFAGHNERGTSDAVAFAHTERHIEDWNILQLLATYSGSQDYEGIRGAGAGVLILALASLVCAGRRDVFMYFALLLIILDCSVKEPLLVGQLINKLAPFKMSSPGRAMLVGCLPLGLLAGLGVEGALQPGRSTIWKVVRCVSIAAAATVVLITLYKTAIPHPFMDIPVTVIVFPVIMSIAVIAAVWTPAPVLWGAVISMLILGETLTWNKHVIPHCLAPGGNLYGREMAQLSEPRTFWDNNRRGTDITSNQLMYDLAPAINGFDALHISAVRQVLCAPMYESMYLRFTEHWEPTSDQYRGNLFLKRPFWLVRQQVVGPLPDKDRLYPVASTVFLEKPGAVHLPHVDADTLPQTSVPEPAFILPLLKRGSDALELAPAPPSREQEVVQGHVPKLQPVHKALFVTVTSTTQAKLRPVFVESETKRTELGRTMTLEDWGGRERTFEIPLPDFGAMELVLKPEFTGPPGIIRVLEMDIRCDMSDEDGRIRVVTRSANRVELDVRNLAGPRVLLFVDAFYPGWQAFIDGKPAPILRANDVFKAIEVTAGTHRVEFVFSSRRVELGLVVSIATLVLAMTMLAWDWRKRRTVPCS